MSSVQVTNIIIQSNATPFLSPIIMSVSFDVLKEIKDEIEWQVIYVGSPSDEKYDQILEQFSMGPFDQTGSMQFTIEAQPPDYTKIPSKDDLLGVSALILSANYQKKEFFRCGYYVYNCYTDPLLIENDQPSTPVDINQVYRNILTDKPRITRFDIQWDMDEETMKILQQQDFKNEQQSGNDINNTNNNKMGFDMFNSQQDFPNAFQSNGIFQQLNALPNMNFTDPQQQQQQQVGFYQSNPFANC